MTASSLKHTVAGWAERLGVMKLVQHIGRGVEPYLYVLAYHRVDHIAHRPHLDPDLISAAPEQFEAQMQLVAREYHPVSAEEVLDAVERGTSLPLDAVLVTVDDGYRDFQDVIFPIAQRYGVRPILFVPTAFVGRGAFWWDQLYRIVNAARAPELTTPLGRLPLRTADDRRRALNDLRAYVKQAPSFDQARREIARLYAETVPMAQDGDRPTLDWDDLRALARAGATIAAHTHTHPILGHISLDQARRELRESQQAIEREIGRALPIFAFPDGRPPAYNVDLMRLLDEEGFKLAFTMVEGRARLRPGAPLNAPDHPLCAPRLSVSPNLTLAQFHLHLTPAYGYRKHKRR